MVEGQIPSDDPDIAREIIMLYSQAGATWQIEAMWNIQESDQVLERINLSPPPSM